MQKVAYRNFIESRTYYLCMLILLILSIGILNSSTANQKQFEAFEKSINNANTPMESLQLSLLSGDWCFDNNYPLMAKRYYERAVTLGKQLDGHILYAEALVKLAGLQEDKLIARTQYQEALSIYEKFSNTRTSIADILEKLIWTYEYLGADFKEVVKLLEEAIHIRQKLPYSTKYSETLRVLAWLYESRSLLSQAEYYYSWAMEEDIKNLTFNDIRTVLSMENFAQFFIDFNLFEKAERLLKRKLKLHQEVQFPDLYNIARTESMLGWVNIHQKKFDQAEAYYKEALRNANISFTRDPNKAHYFSLPALFDLVYFYASQGNFIQAMPYFDAAKRVLAEANESDLFEHIRSIDQDQINEEEAGSYAWAVHAHFLGIQMMLNYLATPS